METLTVRDVMISDVLVVRATWSLSRLSEFLIDHDISGAPVADDTGALVGVVSVTDIVRHGSLPEREAGGAQRPHTYYMSALGDQFSGEDLTAFDVRSVSDVTVGEIMTRTVFEIPADAPLSKAADMLITGRIHRLLVTDAGRIVGLVTALDVLTAVRAG